MIDFLSQKKQENSSAIIQLTLEDIEKNLKKSSKKEDFDNLDEFLNKARKSNGSDGFVTVCISKSAVPYKPVIETPELSDSSKTSEIRFQNNLSQNPSNPKNLKSDRFKFEALPLESIEECLFEDNSLKNEFGQIFQIKSQQLSPRSPNFLNEKSGLKKRSNKGRRKTWKKQDHSHLTQVLSSSVDKLPAIKLADPVLRSFRSIDVLKRHKKNNTQK